MMLLLAVTGGLLAAGAAAAWRWRIVPAAWHEPTVDVSGLPAVMSMEAYSQGPDHARPYIVERTKGRAALLCLGLTHTDDPNSADVALLRRRFAEFAPSVVLVESRLGYGLGGVGAAVRTFGESGAAYVLARDRGVRVLTLEMPLAREIEAVARRMRPEQVALFYVLRPYLGKRRFGPVSDPEGFVSEYVRKRGSHAALRGAIRSVADIDRLWERDFSAGPNWRECDDREGWPGYLNQVAACANEVRNLHWLGVVSELAAQGERMLMVCGSSHAVRLEAALGGIFR